MKSKVDNYLDKKVQTTCTFDILLKNSYEKVQKEERIYIESKMGSNVVAAKVNVFEILV